MPVVSGAVERLLGTLDLPQLTTDVIQTAVAECHADHGALVLQFKGNSEIAARASKQQRTSGDPSQRICLMLAEQAARTRVDLLAERDSATLPGDLRRLLRDEGFRLALSQPLIAGDVLIGTLVLFWRAGTVFVPEDREYAAAFARYAALALMNAHRYTTALQEKIHYEALIEQAAEGMLVLEKATLKLLDANRAAEAMLGFGRVELRSMAIERILSFDPTHRRLLQMGEGSPKFEGSLYPRNSSPIPVAIDASQIVEGRQQFVLLVVRPLGERWRPIQRLIQAEKLAGMSRMTAVIAHEINNPLQAVANALQLLGRPLDQEKRERYLAVAQAEVDRLVTLVRRALDIYQPSREGRRPVSVHALLDVVLEQANQQLTKNGVEIERLWAAGTPRVIGIGSHLKEVFFNLMLNAIEAMPQGGKLSVRTLVGDGAPGMAARIVTIDFTDTGPGIAEEQLDEIFEPFYTTKHNSAGMGLSICYSIIEHHAGRLSVSSSPNGTTFRVILPVAISSEIL